MKDTKEIKGIIAYTYPSPNITNSSEMLHYTAKVAPREYPNSQPRVLITYLRTHDGVPTHELAISQLTVNKCVTLDAQRRYKYPEINSDELFEDGLFRLAGLQVQEKPESVNSAAKLAACEEVLSTTAVLCRQHAADLDDLEDTLADLLDATETLELADEEIESLEAELMTTERKLENALEDLREASGDFMVTDEEFEALEDDLKAANLKLEDALEELVDLQGDLDGAEQEIESLEVELIHTEGDLNKALEEIEQETESLEEELLNADAELNDALEEIKRLEWALESEIETRMETDNTLQETYKEVEELESRIAELEEEF